MRIQHNIMAMNSYRNYNNNANRLSGNLEKLSSGYKINRAGDDAAGLAISEKMRAQISGLEQAQANVKDGISLVKTAEGALQEVQDMLNRMVTLATKSANGTYEDEVDREALQNEINQLTEEIDRIAESANFNGRKLLDGSLGTTFEASVSELDANSAAATAATVGGAGGTMDFTNLNTAAILMENEAKVSGGSAIKTGAINVTYVSNKAIDDDGNTFTGYVLYVGSTADKTSIVGFADEDLVLTGTEAGESVTMSFETADGVALGSVVYTAGTSDVTAEATADTAIDSGFDVSSTTTAATDSTKAGLQLQIGDTANAYNQLRVAINDMSANSLGTVNKDGKIATSIAEISVADIDSATAAIEVINDAINMVSEQRGELGAIQNRLEHTQNNLSVMEENIQDAESTIRDTDIADEMTAYTKNNILIQSAQAMLAQANQVPQGVLSLLQ